MNEASLWYCAPWCLDCLFALSCVDVHWGIGLELPRLRWLSFGNCLGSRRTYGAVALSALVSSG